MSDQDADTAAVPKTPWGLFKWCVEQRRRRPIRGPISGTMVMPKVVLPEGFEPPSAAVIGATQATEHAFEVARLRQAIRAALDELGVPGPGYPAPVANAVAILTRALHIDGEVAVMRWIRDLRWWLLKRKIDRVTGGEPECRPDHSDGS